jgi:tRNA(Ile)-lysidine synthase
MPPLAGSPAPAASAASPLIRKLLQPLQAFPRAERYLIGVSGGRDSVALLHGLHHWLGYRRLVVCHLDHGSRAESAADAEFVKALSTSLGCAFEGGRVEVAAVAKQRKRSFETAAREARYEFFAEVAERLGCHSIFLAHHADDRVETLLFNLCRGAGLEGLTSLQRVSERTVGEIPLKLIRPLLGVWRTEIDEYLARHTLAFREDATNADRQHTRNCLRHDVLPALEAALGHDVRQAIWRTAEILEAEQASQPNRSQLSGEADLSTEHLRNDSVAGQRRLIRLWLKSHAVPNVGFAEVENVRGLLARGTAKINLPGGWHARRRAGRLFLEEPR